MGIFSCHSQRAARWSLALTVGLLLPCLTATLAVSSAAASQPADNGEVLAALDSALRGAGARGYMHGAAGANHQYVFAFDHPVPGQILLPTFPMLTHVPEVLAALPDLRRHDAIRIRGQIITNGAPIPHIYVSELEVLAPWSDGSDLPPYQQQTKIPEALQGLSEIIVRVHAVMDQGRTLVVEYGDAIIPVFVTDTAVSKDLWRNDKILLRFVLKSSPQRPAHLLPAARPDAIVVLERINAGHGLPTVRSGELVKFSKTPQVGLEVFAISQLDADGVRREFTLVNLEDPTVWAAIAAKAGKAWDEARATAVRDRSKLRNPKLWVTASGVLNEVAAEQGNPQVLLASEDDFTITVLP